MLLSLFTNPKSDALPIDMVTQIEVRFVTEEEIFQNFRIVFYALTKRLGNIITFGLNGKNFQIIMDNSPHRSAEECLHSVTNVWWNCKVAVAIGP